MSSFKEVIGWIERHLAACEVPATQKNVLDTLSLSPLSHREWFCNDKKRSRVLKHFKDKT